LCSFKKLIFRGAHKLIQNTILDSETSKKKHPSLLKKYKADIATRKKVESAWFFTADADANEQRDRRRYGVKFEN
jgi:hypothetical protein